MLLPCVASSILNTLPFILPSLGAAIYISVFNLVMQFIFINDVFFNLPMTATTAPKIVKYFGYLMAMNLFTLLIHVIFYVLLMLNAPAPPFLQPIYVAKNWLPEIAKKQYLVERLAGTATWQDLIKIIRLYIAIFFAISNLLLLLI
ncbi:hypothetical protein WR25_18383 [Diploscapter pachys]|uniref:Uncharacterized protein n=1 Tax=Diploscapter pachys TaxID=2018661 RepID=A0A2A2JZD5_9BILA|nr:hypothetical protein WR25_18383 [Diploscapter pachys]